MPDESYKDCPVCLVSHKRFNAVVSCLYRLRYVHFNRIAPDITGCGCPNYCRREDMLNYVKTRFSSVWENERASQVLSTRL